MNTQTKTQTTVDFKCRAQHEPLINYAMQHLGKSRKIILQTKLQIIVWFFFFSQRNRWIFQEASLDNK